MGSDETAITIPGGPRVIDVFYGDGAPSGPNCLLFSDVDRFSDSLWDRSEVGWSPRPHAPVLGALQRAVDRNLWQIMANRGIAQRTLGYVSYTGSGGVGGVGDCTCPVPTPANSERPQDHESTGFHRHGRHGGTVNIANYRNYFFGHPVSVPSISLNQ